MAKKEKVKKEKPVVEAEPQYYRSMIGTDALNYKVYYMSFLEKIGYGLLAFIVGAAIGYLFYGGLAVDSLGRPTTLTYILNVIVMVVCGTAAAILFIPIRTKQIQQKMQSDLKRQFRDMLEALVTAFGSGKNVTDAFIAVYDDMANQYGDGGYIVKELYIINTGVNNGFTLEELLQDLGVRSGVEDVINFADVFNISYRQGGNIKATVRNSCVIISDKMAVAEEIETIVSGSKSEQYIMLVMPIVLIGIIKFSSPDFGSNFATSAGIISTTVGVIMFVASYFLGTKLLDIKI